MEKPVALFQPQVSYTDEEILNKLTSNPIFNQKQQFYENFDAEGNRDHYCQQIIKQMELNNYSGASTAQSVPNGYFWEQEGNLISIHIPFESETEDLNCTIENDQIMSSGSISGRLYRIPSHFEISREEQSLLIKLTVSEQWPVIVAGGYNMDVFSTYILIFFAFQNSLINMLVPLAIHNALRHHFPSLDYLIMIEIQSKNRNALFYWITFCMLHKGPINGMTAALLCEVLIEMKTSESYQLAENILIPYAKENMPTAFLYLGYLYTDTIDGFQSSSELAIEYFRIAGETFKLQRALEVLGQIYIFGINVPKDLKKGYHYLSQTSMTKNEILSMVKEAEYTTVEIQSVMNLSNGSFSNTTKGIILVSVVAVAATILIAFRIRRK